MALPIDLTKRLGKPIAAADLKDGRYVVTFKHQTGGNRARYWQSVVAVRGFGAILGELSAEERATLLAMVA